MHYSLLLTITLFVSFAASAELISPTEPPKTNEVQPAPQPKPQQPVGYAPPPAYPYPIPYGDGYLYPVPNQQPQQQVAYPPAEQTYFSSMIPAAQAALQVALRLFAKVGLFLIGGVALLVVGGIFTTAVCSITPICTITFNGLGIKGIDKDQMRALMTPERISAAAAMVQDAIGKYQRLQRAVSK